MTLTSTFDRVLEMVETLPPEEQDMLIDLVRRRRVEARREEMAENVLCAREEFREGRIKASTVQELMEEFDQ